MPSTILITGATSGLGLQTALTLAAAHPDTQIVAAGRTLPPGAFDNAPNVTFIKLDLASQATTRAFVKDYLSHSFPPISALILNAGVQTVGAVEYSPDNIELMFAVNHANHALLFFLLADHTTPDARIISVSSSTHDPAFGRVNGLEYISAEATARSPNPDSETNDFLQRYALSKLANILFTYALHDRRRNGWIVMALDPGVMPTGLYRGQGMVLKALAGWVFSSSIGRYFIHDLFPTEVTAAVLSEMATGAKFASGKYYGVKGSQEMASSEKSHDKEAQKDLWEWTINEVLTSDEKAAWV